MGNRQKRREEEEERERQRQREIQRQREERERIERINMERRRREEEIERERQRQIKIQEEIKRKQREEMERQRLKEMQFNKAKDEAIRIWNNYNNLKSEISSFKSKLECNYNILKKFYEKYFEELENLSSSIKSRDNDNNVYLQYENISHKIEILTNEKNILTKFVYQRIFYIIKELTKNKRFSESLEIIEELENDFPLDQIDFYDYDKKKYSQALKTIKNHCEMMINYNESIEIFNEKNCDEESYQKSIKLLQDLLYNSKNETQKEFFNKEIRNIKIKYLNSITKKNMILYYSKNYDEIIKESEKIFEKFNDINLSAPLHEMKVVYSMALKDKILIKIDNEENYEEEYRKYNIVTDLENIDNELNDIINNKKNSNKNLNNKESSCSVSEIISLDKIKEYLEKIKQLNNWKLDEKLEEDIISQVNNYNEEIKELQKKRNKLSEWIKINKDNIKKNEFRGRVFGFLNLVNKEIIKYDIRPIQLISLLFLSKNNITSIDAKSQGIFLQINTGEGKSLIIQFFAAYLALQGKKVDIITSNTVLANRDAEEKDRVNFYSQIGLSVGCASKNEYDKNIVYGDTQNFEAGILKEEFKEEEIRNGRTFDCVIVDEVDSISLDNIITMTQLTDNFPGRSCFYFFYYQILIYYCNYISNLVEITGKTQEYYLQNPKEFEIEIKKYIKDNFKNKFLENDGKTLKEDLPIVYPKCMKKYIEDSLDTWIENVIKAPTMLLDRDFLKKDNNIVHIDFINTGVVQNNMIMEGGSQQILEIIHDEKGTFENESTNFLSNISFFKRYNGNIYGVTGTFGGESFQHILKEIYKINLFIIPPNKTSLLTKIDGKICKSYDEYMDKIEENIEYMISQKRSVLLICYSIQEGKEFLDILVNKYGQENVMQYFTEDDKPTIEKILGTSKIIVATNLAGRGTDIKITNDLESNGGLHVLVSFLPLNQRVEDQNYGRAGRNGEKGSYTLIMQYNNEYGPLSDDNLKLDIIKQKREKAEFEGIQKLIKNEMVFIQQKEELFKKFCKYLKDKYSESNTFERANIEEKWGKILKGKDIKTILKNYEKLINEDNKQITNNLIKIQEIVNYSKSDTTIFELEPEYSWCARMVYACNLAKYKVIDGDLSKQKEAINQFNKVKQILDETFLNDLSSQASLNKLVFSLFVQNKEKIEKEGFKTKIESQIENQKNFLEVLKSLIDENINTIQKYIDEYEKRQDDKIETEKFLQIIDIIKNSENINITYKEDIEKYMDEFGFKKFEILVIRKEFHLLSNFIVFAIGICEICIGTALAFMSKNPKVLQLAKFLIQEGVDDIILSIKSTLKGEEINLLDFAKQKAIKTLVFSLSLITKANPGNIKDELLKMLGNKVKEQVKKYGTAWATEKIVKEINNKFGDIIKEGLNKMILIKPEDYEYISYDIILNTDIFRSSIINQAKDIISKTENLFEFFGPLINFIKCITNGQKSIYEKVNEFINFLNTFDFKECYNCINNIFNSIKETKLSGKIERNLSKLINKSNEKLSETEIEKICKELIECNVLNKDGMFNMDYMDDKDFKQAFKIEIDKKFKNIEINKEKQLSKETLDFLKTFKNKFSEKALNFKIEEITNNVYKEIEFILGKYIRMLLDCLFDKACEKLEDIYKKYQNKIQCVKPSLNNNLSSVKKTALKISLDPLIDKLIKILFDWITKKINELIKKILEQFDEIFEEIGEQIIIIQEETGDIIEKILEKVESVIEVFEHIKNIIIKIIDIIKSKGDIKIIIINLVDVTDFMLKNGIEDLTKPIKDCVDNIKSGIKNTIRNEYNKIKTAGIDFYKKNKNKISGEYNKIKNKITNLPDDLAKQLDNKKKYFEKIYKEKKEMIIQKTNIKLNNLLDVEKIDKIFKDIINQVKSKIDSEIKKIKEEIRETIFCYNNYIINLFDDIIGFIDEYMKLDLDEYVDNKFDALEEIVIVILDITIINKNYENEDLNEKNLMDILIIHFTKKIKKCEEFCKFLIVNNLLSLINKIRRYTIEKIDNFQSVYDTIKNMAKKYINLFKQDVQKYLNENFKLMKGFDYFLDYINMIYKKCNLYEIYIIQNLNSINIFINKTVEKINETKNKEIEYISNILEQKIDEEYKKLLQIKDNVKDKINEAFDTVEKNVLNPIDNKICKTASEIENKLMDVAHYVDDKTEKCLEMIYPSDIDTKLFNFIKEKKDNLLNKLNVKEIDEGIHEFSNSNLINESKNLIESIDIDKANSMINDIRNISNSLKIENKIVFRDKVKNKIEEKIMFLYTNNLKPILEELINKACKKIINKII